MEPEDVNMLVRMKRSYTNVRIPLRQMLSDIGISSSPFVDDKWILAQIKESLKPINKFSDDELVMELKKREIKIEPFITFHTSEGFTDAIVKKVRIGGVMFDVKD